MNPPCLDTGAGSAVINYTYDAWNRLVKVEHGSTPVTIAEFEYNALHHRITKRTDVDADETMDQQREMYYTSSSRLLKKLRRWMRTTIFDMDGVAEPRGIVQIRGRLGSLPRTKSIAPIHRLSLSTTPAGGADRQRQGPDTRSAVGYD